MSVNLILKSTDISTLTTVDTYFNKKLVTNTGSVSNSRLSFVFKNIDMKVLLGDLFEKYEQFNISLTYVSGAATGAEPEALPNKRSLQVKLSGLPFVSSYNQKTSINNNVVVCSCIIIPPSANTIWESKNNIAQTFTFTKTNICDINIDLHAIHDDSTPTITTNNQMIGHVLFSFQIQGVEDSKIDQMDIVPNRAPIDTYGYNKPNKKSNYIL
jgi:hypothetical protein